MRKIIYYILICISIIGILFFGSGIINSMVSLKYETISANSCISAVSGADLCFAVKVYIALSLTCIIGIISLFVFKKKILYKNKKD